MSHVMKPHEFQQISNAVPIFSQILLIVIELSKLAGESLNNMLAFFDKRKLKMS